MVDRLFHTSYSPSEMKAELILDAKAEHGEGPVWDAANSVLYWVDIVGCKLHVFDPSTGDDRSILFDQNVCCVAPREQGGLVAGMRNGLVVIDPETGDLTPVCDPESDQPGNRFNDGKCDPAGRFWAGTCSENCDVPGAGSLYCLTADGNVEKKLGDMTIPNGLCWSPDHTTMYFIDTPTMEVWAFDYDRDTGRIDNRRTVVKAPEDGGFPDGMTIDAEGMLWVAHWGGSCVRRWDPETGGELDRVDLPVTNVSCCVFAGPDLKELYITTSRLTLDEAALSEQPLAGGLFHCSPGVKGSPTYSFKG